MIKIIQILNLFYYCYYSILQLNLYNYQTFIITTNYKYNQVYLKYYHFFLHSSNNL